MPGSTPGARQISTPFRNGAEGRPPSGFESRALLLFGLRRPDRGHAVTHRRPLSAVEDADGSDQVVRSVVGVSVRRRLVRVDPSPRRSFGKL